MKDKDKFFHNLGGPKQPSMKQAVADEAKHVASKSKALAKKAGKLNSQQRNGQNDSDYAKSKVGFYKKGEHPSLQR